MIDQIGWSGWRQLKTVSRDAGIPSGPGLYRIHRVGHEGIDYIGQTGGSLRQRLGMLRGAYAVEMPYNDPHTAAPGLWALRHAYDCEFEVAVTEIESSKPWRLGLEALAISLYRVDVGKSPTLNFGRMPRGYLKSSGNNQRLVAAGKRFRGGLASEILESHSCSVSSGAPLEGEVGASNWCGQQWSDWLPLREAVRRMTRGIRGLYRIRRVGEDQLIYVGQGSIASRSIGHLRRWGQGEEVVADLQHFECSWVETPGLLANQRLELENDLIASHMLVTGALPERQFAGH
jgi:hypothetical protein